MDGHRSPLPSETALPQRTSRRGCRMLDDSGDWCRSVDPRPAPARHPALHLILVRVLAAVDLRFDNPSKPRPDRPDRDRLLRCPHCPMGLDQTPLVTGKVAQGIQPRRNHAHRSLALVPFRRLLPLPRPAGVIENHLSHFINRHDGFATTLSLSVLRFPDLLATRGCDHAIVSGLLLGGCRRQTSV